MRITTLVSWFDEPPSWLAAVVAGAARFSDRVVALDGAYQLYPDARAASPSEQRATIMETAAACGMGVEVVVPSEAWRGEVEKRAALFAYGLVRADADEWFFVADADEIITRCPERAVVEHDLEHAGLVAAVTIHEIRDVALQPLVARRFFDPVTRYPARKFFRALPGLTVEDAHYVYTAVVDDEKRYLWGGDQHDLEPAGETSIVVEHRVEQRAAWRRDRQREYYRRRDAAGVEQVSGVV